MKVSKSVTCMNFPCKDVDQQAYMIPEVNIEPRNIRIFMVSEASPPDKNRSGGPPQRAICLKDDLFPNHRLPFFPNPFTLCALYDELSKGINRRIKSKEAIENSSQ